MHSEPLVTAIMPTLGRTGWAHDAVRMFHQQTWANKELVIVDDLMERSFPAGARGSGIQYVAAPRVSIGEKRNMAVSMAAGQIIMHWDSDDVYRSDRMEHQANLLMEMGVDLVGYNTMEFEDVDFSKRYFYRASQDYAIGVSQCYWRDSWEKSRFDAIDKGEDSNFLKGRQVFCCDAEGRIVARIHHGNTCDKRVDIPTNTNQWRPMRLNQAGKWELAA